MPNAGEYRSAAANYDELAEDLEAVATRPAEKFPATEIDGPFRTYFEEHIGECTSSMNALAGRLRALAAQCRWRATKCDAYHTELASHPDATPDYPWIE